MRILLTADPEIPVPPVTYGGIERIVAGLIEELTARGHKVGLAAHPDSTASVAAFFPWPGTESQNRGDTVRNALALRRAVRAFRPDVIHSFSRLMYLLPLLRSRVPKVMSYQRDTTLKPIQLARRMARAGTLRFTGCSEYICGLGRAAGGDWTAIPNFVDLDKYKFQPAVSPNAPLVFLSRVEPIKGADVAIRIARRTGRRLIIAGNHATDDSDNGRFWRERIEPHLGRNGIDYVGPVTDIQKDELLGRAAALLVPIQWDEPFGIVFAEALACGTPVISRPKGALPEIIRDGKEGFLANTDDRLSEAINRIPEISRQACRLRAAQLYSSRVVVGTYDNLYTSMIQVAQ